MKDVTRFRIAILASGSGTNAEAIMHYFRDHPGMIVALVLSNNPMAGVIERAIRNSVPAKVFDREQLLTGEVSIWLHNAEITHVVLAGFLWLVPKNILKEFPGRIINIHPSLLPKFGGAGMYGRRVHEAVIDAGEKETGITIHEVNERYDDGRILVQAKCDVALTDTADLLADKIHALEYRHYPKAIEQWIMNNA